MARGAVDLVHVNMDYCKELSRALSIETVRIVLTEKLPAGMNLDVWPRYVRNEEG